MSVCLAICDLNLRFEWSVEHVLRIFSSFVFPKICQNQARKFPHETRETEQEHALTFILAHSMREMCQIFCAYLYSE